MNVKDRIQKHIQNLASPDKEIAIRAERFLIRWYGDRAFGQLLEACNHPNPSVRFRAVWALASTKNPLAFETVLRLTDDQDESVRYDATMALGVLEDDRAIEPLLRIAREHDETRPAVGVLWDFGVKAIASFKSLLSESDARLRAGAANGFGHIVREHNSRECFEILRECLSDPDDSVREEARYWLNDEYHVPTDVSA